MRVSPTASATLAVIALLAGPTAGASNTGFEFDWTPAERIVVDKSKRKLILVRKDKEERAFDISLGANPVGHKEREGDSRTPEGRYFVDYKNFHSDYYLSVRISYPNDGDRESARQRGEQPGGNIMIHGLPNDAQWPYDGLLGRDWTDGCIAVSNAAMQQIWLAVRDKTPVEILP